MRFEHQRIAVTGGSGGIGARLVDRLIEEGAEVTTFGRQPPANPAARFAVCDLATMEGVDRAAAILKDEPWDLLINLAGVQYFGPVEAEGPDHLCRTYSINLLAPVRLCQAVVTGMKQARHGKIVNVGSIFGSINFAHFASYSSSKAGLKAFSQALRRELHGTGVGVVYVAPRAVKTPFNSPRVLEYAAQTKMAMDDPDWVAGRILSAIAGGKRDVYLGFPEAFFVRLNALFPSIVDRALAGKTRLAARLFA